VRLFHALRVQGYLNLLETDNEGVSKDVCEYHSGARGHWNIAKSSRGVIRRKMAGAKKVDCCMTSHKQHTPKDLSKKVERLEDEFAKMTQYVERLTSLVRFVVENSIRNVDKDLSMPF
jgi:hypothetical protein